MIVDRTSDAAALAALKATERRRAARTRAVVQRIKDLQVAAGTRLPKDEVR